MKDTLIILLREQGFSYPYVHAITAKLLEALSVDRRPEHEVMNDLRDIGKALSILNNKDPFNDEDFIGPDVMDMDNGL